MNVVTRFGFFFIAFLPMIELYAVDFSKINTSYWYDPNAAFSVQSRVVQSNSDLSIFVDITYRNGVPDNAEWVLQEDYVSSTERQIPSYISDTISNSNEKLSLGLMFSEVKDKLLVLRIEKGATQFYFPIDLVKGKLPFSPFYPLDENGKAITKTYVKEGSLNFAKVSENDTLYFYQYKEDFEPADPPMGAVKVVSPTLTIDSVFASVGEVELSANHFYFIQEDTLSNEGLTIYAGPEYYPSSRLIEELVLPIRYFTRTSEITKIKSSSNPKREFDNFWLGTFSSEERARGAIRSYYRLVRQANEVFTDYKQGWKTDRGMLYIIFGTPLEVNRSNRREIWKYADAEFEFRIISNLFAPSLFVLMRDKDYDTVWIERIKTMREGL